VDRVRHRIAVNNNVGALARHADPAVRAHLIETTTSNFLFALLTGWLWGKNAPRQAG